MSPIDVKKKTERNKNLRMLILMICAKKQKFKNANLNDLCKKTKINFSKFFKKFLQFFFHLYKMRDFQTNGKLFNMAFQRNFLRQMALVKIKKSQFLSIF